MVTLNTTPNRGYQEPAVGNTLEVDVGRLIAALRAIDVDVADALAQIVAKAGLASPAFTGTPTAPTAAPGTDSGQLATTAFVKAALAALVGLAPDALDTLNELAAAIGDDPNFAATMTALIGTKADAAATTAALAGKAGLADHNVFTDVNSFTKIQKLSKGADVASAAALTLGTDGNYFDVTGTTAITSIATVGVGTVIRLHFNGALTLTHHATDLVLPGGVNITTVAGDEAEFVEYASGDWRCTNYQANSLSPILHVRDQKAQGIDGGTSISGGQIRALNTVVTNGIAGASLASNKVTLPAGTYDVIARVPFFRGNRSKAWLRAATSSALLISGSSEYSANSDTSTGNSWVMGRFTLGSTTDVEIAQNIELGVATNGLGSQANVSGQPEVYTDVIFRKVG